MEENNNSPRTLKIELPVVDNSGHDEEDDEEDVVHHVADKDFEEEGGTQLFGDEAEKPVETPGDEEQKQTHKENQEEQKPEPTQGETEEKHAFLTDKDETFIEEDENLQEDKHSVGGEENTMNERITEGPEVNLTEQKSSSANAHNQNKEKLNLPVTHSANGAKLIDHSDTETVVSYDPTGTHIIEYSESQSYVKAASEIALKKVEEADKLQIQTKSNVSGKSNLQNKTEDTNNDPSGIHKHIERPSDTVPRPVKHKRKQQLALTAEEEDLGIYEDTADGDDLTDTELEVMKSKFRSAKLHKEYEKVLEEAELKTEHKNTEKPITEETMTMKPIAEAVKRTKPTIKSAPKPLREINMRDFKEFRERLERGKTAVSCITDVFQESRFVANISFFSNNILRKGLTFLNFSLLFVVTAAGCCDMWRP